ncbi:MAG: DUF4038 domain-containing protein [Kiritimatiellae bacterium]|nr:DUF4038 domain-containing protein [Kiritimatiellia bacterium]
MNTRTRKNAERRLPDWETRPWEKHGKLRVSSDGHFMQHEDGTGFFWLGDTAWHLGRMPPADIDRYMRNRAQQGFTVTQVIASLWTLPNYAGEVAFEGDGPPYAEVRFNETYWAHMDLIVLKAKENGLHVALVPFWGRNADNPFHNAPWNTGLHGQCFADPDTHNYEFGKALGARYANEPHVLWIVSGEYHTPYYHHKYRPLPQIHIDRLKRLAAGIRAGDTGRHLMTIHPLIFLSSSDDFHHEDWLDFNMIQSHSGSDYIPQLIGGDWELLPPKPTVNGEPAYEGARAAERTSAHTLPFDSAWAQRYQAYWSVFSGAAGFTYGHQLVFGCAVNHETLHALLAEWQTFPGTLPQDALDAPGAASLQHLRRLIECKPIQSRIPDQALLTVNSRGSVCRSYDHEPGSASPGLRCATRDRHGKWAFVYSTRGLMFKLVLSRLANGSASAFWFNPRNGLWRVGKAEHIEKKPLETGIPTGTGAADRYFLPPGEPADDNDWVLVLEVD